MRFMAEPGRYYARSAYTLVCKVISRRLQAGAQPEPDMLYQNDGVYGSFMNVLIEKEVLHPSLVASGFHSLEGGGERHEGKFRYSIWGPTCDSTDRVVEEMAMGTEVKVGDWLKYTHMGGRFILQLLFVSILFCFSGARLTQWPSLYYGYRYSIQWVSKPPPCYLS